MTEKALQALKESIEHWEKNVNDPDNATLGLKHCSLCVTFFYHKTQVERCIGCPVHEKTGKPYCANTPYTVAAELEGRDGFVEAAQEELDYLKSLLPK